MTPERLDHAFFSRATELVAEELVGCELFRRTADGLVAGTIVETEAYGGSEDPASHAALYPRSRAVIMASAPGTVYVYRSYGVHDCFNIVANVVGGVGAVLIRAVEPTMGLDVMRRRRGAQADIDLCRGPGRLCQAFAIVVDDSLTDVVVRDDLWVVARGNAMSVDSSPRIGITKAVEIPWRFFARNSRFVSATRVVAG